MLKNADVASAGVLPFCQDTGTAIILGKKGNAVWSTGDEEALAQGVYIAYTENNLRYSQTAPLTMWEEKNTNTNLARADRSDGLRWRPLRFLVRGERGRFGEQVVPVPGNACAAQPADARRIPRRRKWRRSAPQPARPTTWCL